MTQDVVPGRSRGWLQPTPTPWLLALVPASHASLGVYKGATDGGDYSLLYAAAPMMGLTVLAAVLSAARRPWARTSAVAATVVSLLIAFVLVPAYGLGLFHLPQSIVAVMLASRSAA